LRTASDAAHVSPMAAPTATIAERARYHDHIVDELIAERAPKLVGSPAWPLLRPALYALLDYGKARAMADAIYPMSGKAALDYVSDLLALKVVTSGLERIPRAGAIVTVSNHPTGIADGVAVYDALKTVRPDLVFYANADAHRVVPGFADMLIPVELNAAKRSREATRLTLQMTHAAMQGGKALVTFPSGRLARRRGGVLTDDPWAPTPISLARKFGAPIVPIHVVGPWSTLFHLFDRFSGELRDITLFHELLNKRGQAFRLIVGEPIDAESILGDPPEAVRRLKDYVEFDLPKGRLRLG
jgi:putative hemolysin